MAKARRNTAAAARVQPRADAHTGSRGISPRGAMNTQPLVYLAAYAPMESATPRDASKLLPFLSRNFAGTTVQPLNGVFQHPATDDPRTG
jgi:hypothetical protein